VDNPSPDPFSNDIFMLSSSCCIFINWSFTFWYYSSCFLVAFSMTSFATSCTW
jgi:hypothetical protein